MAVLVVGGGITGLAAAYELARAGVPVAPRRGDRAPRRQDPDGAPSTASSSRPGRTRSSATGRRPSSWPASWAWATRSSGRPTRAPSTSGRAAGCRRCPTGWASSCRPGWRPFVTTRPLLAASRSCGWGSTSCCRATASTRDVAVGTFLRHRLGAALVDRLADPLIGGVYGTPVDELSLLAVVPQLRDSERRPPEPPPGEPRRRDAPARASRAARRS